MVTKLKCLSWEGGPRRSPSKCVLLSIRNRAIMSAISSCFGGQS
jgi:hypothetical protein